MIKDIEQQIGRVPRRYTTLAERRRWVERLRKSGMTHRAFAREHGITLSSLNNWIRQADKGLLVPARKPPVSLTEVALPPGLLSPWAAEVSRPDGVTIRMSAALACEVVAGLLKFPSC